MEDEQYKVKAVLQGHQGGWTMWETIVNRSISWSDLCKIPQARLSFLIRSTYSTLPCPRNLHQWFSNEESCPLCNAPKASLQHILSVCKTALSQGRYRWQHNQVLKKLVEVLEVSRQDTNRGFPPVAECHIQFLRQGGSAESTRPRAPTQLLYPGKEWNMRVPLTGSFSSTAAKTVLLIELTIP